MQRPEIVRVSTAGETESHVIPTPRSFPAHVVVGPDGAIWITENIGNKIARFAP